MTTQKVSRSRVIGLVIVEIIALICFWFWMNRDVPADDPPRADDWFATIAFVIVFGACWFSWRWIGRTALGTTAARGGQVAQLLTLVPLGIAALGLVVLPVAYIFAF